MVGGFGGYIIAALEFWPCGWYVRFSVCFCMYILVNRLSSVLLIPHIIRSLYINTILLHRNHHTQHTTHIVANVHPVQPNENAQSLWGDIANPKTALEENGFQMRHVVLTARRRN